MRLASSQRVPVSCASRRSASARVRTTGSRGGRLARTSPSSHASFPPEHLLIEEQQRRERLILRASRDTARDRQVVQEGRHLRLAQLARMALAVKENEAPDPVHVGLLRAAAEILASYRLVDSIKKSRRGRGRTTSA